MAFFGPPPPFVGATTSANGVSGLVPAPTSGRVTRVLGADSNFQNPIQYPTYKNTSNIISNLIFGFNTGIGLSGNPTLNERKFSLIYIPADGDIDELLYRVGTTPSPAYSINISVWDIGSDGLPSTYIIGGNATTGTTGNTDISISITPTSFKSGNYYISHTPNSTGTVGSVVIYGSGWGRTYLRHFVGCSNLNANGLVIGYTCANSYDQQTHETFLTTDTPVPVCGLRYA